MNLRMVCGMFVWCSLCVSVCILTVSNALLLSNVTAIVRAFWWFVLVEAYCDDVVYVV